MSTKILAAVVSAIVFFIVVELVRRGKLTFKYALGWLVISFLAMFFVVFDRLLINVSQWFGFELPSNFIFFSLLGFFVFLSILLTTFLCGQNIRNDTMAQKIGILEMELEELKEQFSKKDKNGRDSL